MLDPKIHRERKIGRKWTTKIRPESTYGGRCSACQCAFWEDEASVRIHNHWMHRQCLKEWIEASYLTMPPQPDEIERTQFGEPDVVDFERLQREFDEYRDELVQRLGVE